MNAGQVAIEIKKSTYLDNNITWCLVLVQKDGFVWDLVVNLNKIIKMSRT